MTSIIKRPLSPRGYGLIVSVLSFIRVHVKNLFDQKKSLMICDESLQKNFRSLELVSALINYAMV